MSAVKLPEIAPLTPKTQSVFYVYHLNFLDNIPLLLGGGRNDCLYFVSGCVSDHEVPICKGK